MQHKKDFKEYQEEFTSYYKCFLRNEKDIDQIITDNGTALTNFKDDWNLDSKSIDLLPAYFNFIECYLEKKNYASVKQFLIVGLSNLMFSSKKKDDNKEGGEEVEEDEELLNDKKSKRSRLDLLFARFNLEKQKWENAIEKLTNSIILYSEIYGPESVGLTSHYYYLAIYFLEKPEDSDKHEDKRDVIVKNIFLKIADIWKKFFTEDKNDQFVGTDASQDSLNFVVGEYYVKKILSKLRQNFQKELELELKFKMIKALILKQLGSEIFSESLNQVNKLKENYTMADRSFMEELEGKLNTSNIVNPNNISNNSP